MKTCASVEDVTLPAENLREVLFHTFLIACKAFNMSVGLPAALALMFHTCARDGLFTYQFFISVLSF